MAAWAQTNSHLVVMAGGSGTRFWPKSTIKRPKQLLSFGAETTLLRQTLDRFDGIVDSQNRIIVTTELIRDLVGKEASEARVLAEPQGRNTAPCIYWAAREMDDPESVMLVMPADHYIADIKSFKATIIRAIACAAQSDNLVTLGVKPTHPETGYGYLKVSRGRDSHGIAKVEAFIEKPSMDRAQSFFKDGSYLWNGGMFVWKTSVILKAFDCFMPEMRQAWDLADGDALRAYPQLTATSIDYGIMEKAPNVVTLPLDCGWSDVGCWTALEALAEPLKAKKKGGTVIAGELIAVESSGHIVDAPGKLVAVLGVDNLIIVESGNSILVAKKERAQDIRKVVDAVKGVNPELV